MFGSYKSCLKSSNFSYSGGKSVDIFPKPPAGGETGGIAVLALSKAPKYVRQIVDHLKRARHMNPPRGFKGGRVFRNREGKLPPGKTYYEFDVHPLRPGVSRGTERLVVDREKTVFYYTKDHYNTFIQIQQ